MKITGDPRLVGAVIAAIEHFAQGAGLDEAAQRQLVSAAEHACLETFGQLESKDTPVEVLIEHHPDRLEILFAHAASQAPAIGLDSFLGAAGATGPGHGVLLLTLVDRVLYDCEGGKSRLRLVKYLHPGGKLVQ
jgi:hypothetical protein